MDFYSIDRDEFYRRCPFPLKVLSNWAALNQEAARNIVELISLNNSTGKDTALILPVGPLLYEPFADLCNERKVMLNRLTIFMMDEYLQPDGKSPIPESHPLSFKAFMMRQFVSKLDPELCFSSEQLVFPLPHNMREVSGRILSMGGVDLCFGGVGISGHLAFNDPPEPDETDKGLDWARGTTARIVTISRESTTQMACGGTFGNWDIIPRQAVTLGMKELLASKRICLCAMRSWHAGTIRRAIFGPIGADCPASLVQEHPHVEILATELALRPPLANITLDVGEEDSK